MRWWWLVWLSACATPLPDPDSPGAQVLQRRCAGCHAVPAPASMTVPMWEMQLERMRGLFVQRGMPWLSDAELGALRTYLASHGGRQ